MPYSFQMRLGSDNEYTNMLMDAISNEIHCAAPAIVNRFYPEDMTVDVQLTTKDKILINGEYVSLKIKQLGKLPVVFMGGGNFVITCPIKEGDECLVIFSDSCIDAWWQNGGEENEPIIMRKHHLSDGFAIVGPRSVPNAIVDYNEDSMEIRDLTGIIKVQISDTNVKMINATNIVDVADDSISLTSPTININGTTTTQSGSDTKIEVLGDSIVLSKGGSTITIGASGVSITAASVLINGKEFATHRHADGTGTTPPYVGQTGIVV